MFDLDLGIDLGATGSRIYEPRRRVLVQQPAAAAAGCGTSALSTATVERSVRHLLDVVHRGPLRRPRVVMTVPCHTPMPDRRELEAATRRAGARTAVTIEAPVAAAIGAGVEVGEAAPSMVVDIGGCWTEVAVLADGAMQRSTSIPVGGTAIDRAIARRARATHGVELDPATAEELKLTLGSAVPLAQEGLAEVRGTDAAGRTRTAIVSSDEVRRWIRDPVDAMLTAVASVLDHLPPRMSADLLDGELVLTGGGALLVGLDHRMAAISGMTVRVAQQSQIAAVLGAGSCVEQVVSVGAEGLEPPTSAV